MENAQDWVREGVDWIILIVEAAGAVVIAIGVFLALLMFARALRHPLRDTFDRARLVLGSYLVLGLEFQLAADILKTAIAPSFTEIGQLAAIAGIRTVLNYFLEKDIARQEARIAADGGDGLDLPTIRH